MKNFVGQLKRIAAVRSSALAHVAICVAVKLRQDRPIVGQKRFDLLFDHLRKFLGEILLHLGDLSHMHLKPRVFAALVVVLRRRIKLGQALAHRIEISLNVLIVQLKMQYILFFKCLFVLFINEHANKIYCEEGSESLSSSLTSSTMKSRKLPSLSLSISQGCIVMLFLK